MAGVDSSAPQIAGMEDIVAPATGTVAANGKASTLERAGTLSRAGSNLGLQRASTLPKDDKDLRHAATMPITHDVESLRPFCGGVWKLQQMMGFLIGIALLLGISLASPIDLNGASNRMLGLTLMCGCFWVFEVLPICITAVIPLVMMPLLKITSSRIAAQAYWDPVQMLLIGTYLVDIALEEVQLPRRAALKLLSSTGVVNPSVLLFFVMFACWVLSMLCNNIAVTLMVAPFVIGLINATEEQVMTEAAEAHLEAQEPSDTSDAQQRASVTDVKRLSRGLMLGIAYSSTAGGIATLVGCIPNELLMSSIFSEHVTYSSWMLFAFPVSVVAFVLSYVVLCLRFTSGLTIKALTQEVLQTEYEELMKEIGPFSRDELLVAMVQFLQFSLLFCRPWIGSLTLFQTAYGESLVGDSTLACLPAVLLFFCPSVVRPGQSVLTWPAVHDKFDFGLVLLIGGGFAIASGFVQSGLNVALGDGLAGAIDNVPLVWLTLIIVTICAIATQVFSAVGTATTIIPVLQSTAARAVYNPLGLVLPATVACSFAFALPMATPANIVVMAKSQDLSGPLRVRDFFLTGLPINLAIMVIGAFMMYFLGGAVFDTVAPYPQWACDGVSCIWASVPGSVNGFDVTSQACTTDVASTMEFCKLANGTWVNVSEVYTPM